MISSKILRSIDTAAGDELDVSITRDRFISGGHLVILTDSTQIPYHRLYLTVAEARKLAEYLDEQAGEADLLNLEADADV